MLQNNCVQPQQQQTNQINGVQQQIYNPNIVNLSPQKVFLGNNGGQFQLLQGSNPNSAGGGPMLIPLNNFRANNMPQNDAATLQSSPIISQPLEDQSTSSAVLERLESATSNTSEVMGEHTTEQSNEPEETPTAEPPFLPRGPVITLDDPNATGEPGKAGPADGDGAIDNLLDSLKSSDSLSQILGQLSYDEMLAIVDILAGPSTAAPASPVLAAGQELLEDDDQDFHHADL